MNSRIEYLLQHSKDELFAEIRRITETADEERERLDRAVSQILALLRNEGYSYFHLRYITSVIERPEPFKERLNLLYRLITRSPEAYEVYFLVKTSDSALFRDGIGKNIAVEDRDEISAKNSEASTRFLGQDQGGTVVSFKLESLDPYGAMSEASRALRELGDSARLYRNQPLFSAVHDFVLVRHSRGDYHIYDERTLFFEFGTTAHDFDRKFHEHLELLATLRNEERIRLQASLQYYSVALDSPDYQVVFINLWIALEALFQETDGDSVIGRIRRTLPRVVASNYLIDILRELAKDLVRNKGGDFSVIECFFPRSTPKYIDLSELLEALSDNENGPRITALLQFTGNHELLVHRVYRLWKEYFRERDVLYRRIKRHVENVDWQIARLYRVRNAIMHQGSADTDLIYLSHHLNHYYRIAIHKCLGTLRENAQLTVMGALTVIREEFELTMTMLKERPDVTTADLLPVYRSDAPSILWSTTSTTEVTRNS